jgi:chemotaxis protein methyltransferase CheR
MTLTQKRDDTLTDADLAFLCQLIRERAAIVLDANKAYLLKARLEPFARANGYGSIAALVTALRSPLLAKSLAEDVVDAMTTNETSFFRDFHPFETLRTIVLPALIKKRSATRTLNIWCAASSSGQEPYSTAMLLREHFPELATWNVKFIASDISKTMLARCREGVYSQIEINRGLPVNYMLKYFKQSGSCWQINEDIRKSIEFRELNLIKPWPFMPRLDLVMIRNVLIYFDADVKKRIFSAIYDLMNTDGCMFLGTAETTLNIDERFKRVPQGSTSYYIPGSGN